MDDERNQRDQQKAEGLAGDLLLPPDLFEVSAQGAVADCSIWLDRASRLAWKRTRAASCASAEAKTCWSTWSQLDSPRRSTALRSG
jgi:hypothetical protein